MTALLEVTGLGKRFGGLAAVDDVNVKIPRGVVTGLIGPNGAGKTTLFSLIRQLHPKFQNNPPGVESQRMLRGIAQIVDALNPVRNRKSMAHPTEELLEEPEAMLAANAIRSLLHYLNMKLR